MCWCRGRRGGRCDISHYLFTSTLIVSTHYVVNTGGAAAHTQIYRLSVPDRDTTLPEEVPKMTAKMVARRAKARIVLEAGGGVGREASRMKAAGRCSRIYDVFEKMTLKLLG